MQACLFDKLPFRLFLMNSAFCPIAVGAYRIRPEDIRMDMGTHSGVCDTPLHGMFAEFNLFFIYWVGFGVMFYFYFCITNLISWL